MKTTFKVGDKIRATSDRYGVTTKRNKWEGVVTSMGENGRFNADTTKCSQGFIGNTFFDLKPEYFELIPPAQPTRFKIGDRIKASKMATGYTYATAKNHWEGIITEIDPRCVGLDIKAKTTRCDKPAAVNQEFWVNSKYFELIEPQQPIITIYRNGNVTTAFLEENGRVVGRAVAKCSPEDEFKLEIGAKLALERLFAEDFKPHLEYDARDWGTIGASTKMKDALGRPLFVGDVVISVRPDRVAFEDLAIVCEVKGSQFVMGIAGWCLKDGRIINGWKVYKVKDHSELTNGETYCDIKAVIKEPAAK